MFFIKIQFFSYRPCDRLLLRVLGVTVFPLRTLHTLGYITQTRRCTVRPIWAWNGVGVLCIYIGKQINKDLVYFIYLH